LEIPVGDPGSGWWDASNGDGSVAAGRPAAASIRCDERRIVEPADRRRRHPFGGRAIGRPPDDRLRAGRYRRRMQHRATDASARSWARRPRTLVDLAIAGVVAVLAVVEVSVSSAERPPGERAADVVAYALVTAGAAALVARRRAPVPVFALVSAALATYWIRDHGALLAVLGLPAVFAVAAHEPRRTRAWWALAVGCGALLLVASVSVFDTPEGFAWLQALSVTAFLIGATVAGVVVRHRERIFVDTERRAAEAEAGRVAAAARAVGDERARIAREMHDVVAHGMSVIAVQAAAGREIVHADPDRAAEVFARIEGVGREALAELRRMLGVLRTTGDEGVSLSPQPGIGDIAACVAESCESGVPTALVVEGDRRPLAPGVELAAFRIVQEALTNVLKHAGRSASAQVRLVYDRDSLVVEVVDDGKGAVSALSGAGTGNGLIGMRERVEIYGGELASGPRPGGGFAVRAVLPAGAPEDGAPSRTPTSSSGGAPRRSGGSA